MDLGLRDDFMNWAPKASKVKAKINEGDYIKLKNFGTQQKKLTKQKGNKLNDRRYLQTTASTQVNTQNI